MVLLVLFAGCVHCGSYSAKTGMSENGTSFDRDDYFETCGVNVGVNGSFDLLGDGNAWLDFAPSHRNEDVDWAAVSLDLSLFLPNSELVEGAHIVDATGDAYVADMSGNHFAVAALTAATVDVLAVREADPVCTPFRAQEFQLEWDAAWASGEYAYTAKGKDWVSLFLDESSSDTGCW